MSLTEAQMRENLLARPGVQEVKSVTTHYDPRANETFILARVKAVVKKRKSNRWFGMVESIGEVTQLTKGDYDKIRKRCATSVRRYSGKKRAEAARVPVLTAERLAGLTGKPLALCERHVQKLRQRNKGTVLAAAALRATVQELGLVDGLVMIHWYYDTKTGELRGMIPSMSGTVVLWSNGDWRITEVSKARASLGSCNVYNRPQQAA